MADSGIRSEVDVVMKHAQILKSFSALSFDGKAVKAATVTPPANAQAGREADRKQRDAASTSEQFRGMLQERSAAPYVFTPAYRPWGINE